MNNQNETALPPIRKIVTHAGKAHEDETYAAAHALFKNPGVPLYRVLEVDPEDLEDPSVLVLDVGMDHNPSKRNFDHHQFQNDLSDPSKNHCALTLYFIDCFQKEGLTAEDLYAEMTGIFPWIETLAIKDTTGIGGLAQWLGVDKNQMLQGVLCQPGSTFWTQFLGKQEVYMPESMEHKMLQMLGQHIHSSIAQIYERLDFLDNGGIKLIQHNGMQIALILVNYDEEPSRAVSIWISRYYRKHRQLQRRVPTIELTIYQARTQTYAVYDPASGRGRVSLKNLANHPEVDFCHSANYLAVFKHQDLPCVLAALTENADKNS